MPTKREGKGMKIVIVKSPKVLAPILRKIFKIDKK